jgi:hypothetical protein
LIPGPYLRAKWHWEREEPADAAPAIDALAGGRPGSPALWLPPDVLEARTRTVFESALAGFLATDDHLLVPFDDAATCLWRAFPGQVVIHVLEQRAAAGRADTRLLHVIAEDGALALDAADRDRIDRVVLDAEAAPTLAGLADLDELRRVSAAATRRLPAERLAELLLDAVFHRTPVAYPELAVDALARLVREQPEAADLAAAELGARHGEAARDVVRIGMRLDDGSPDCLSSLVEAIRSRSFDAFAEDCLLD